MVKALGFEILWVFLLLSSGCAVRHIDWQNAGAPAGAGFLSRSITLDGETRPYTVFIPHNYSARNHSPVILFLHGLFEGGYDGKKCAMVGLGPAIDQRKYTFPFIAVLPQSGGTWTGQRQQ